MDKAVEAAVQAAVRGALRAVLEVVPSLGTVPEAEVRAALEPFRRPPASLETPPIRHPEPMVAKRDEAVSSDLEPTRLKPKRGRPSQRVRRRFGKYWIWNEFMREQDDSDMFRKPLMRAATDSWLVVE
jgi:hypothetical protein